MLVFQFTTGYLTNEFPRICGKRPMSWSVASMLAPKHEFHLSAEQPWATDRSYGE